jgi:cysteine desulfurase
VVKRTLPKICNTALKEYMEANGVIVSVGSACNTSSPKASHVLYAMGADDLIRAGAIRVSLGCDNTYEQAEYFVTTFIAAIAANQGKKH